MISQDNIAGPIRLPILLNNVIREFQLTFFQLKKGGYYVVDKGTIEEIEWLPVRVHSACNLAHIFHSERCDCQKQLELALQRIQEVEKGIVIYALQHEGRAVGPFDHVRVYQQQDKGFDTVDAYTTLGLPIDSRDYSEVIEILKFYRLKKITLLTNNPSKMKALETDFEIRREPLLASLHKFNESQLKAKVEKLGHFIPLGTQHE